jgi:hypothetical protein
VSLLTRYDFYNKKLYAVSSYYAVFVLVLRGEYTDEEFS